MNDAFENWDAQTRAALNMGREELIEKLGERVEIVADTQSMCASAAHHIEQDYLDALAAGRENVTIIVPVGPPEQFQMLAEKCLSSDLSRDRMTVILMDEYLDGDGAWIAQDHPLSFRRIVQTTLIDPLPEERRPRFIVPDPRDLSGIERTITQAGGVDVCYAGVGITGHLAFNDPIPGWLDAQAFAALATRCVNLPVETRLLISMARTRGNLDQMPKSAVTVGMKEILGAAKIRMFMNQDWHATATRRLAFGPVTAAFPASLVQTHTDWSVHIVENAL